MQLIRLTRTALSDDVSTRQPHLQVLDVGTPVIATTDKRKSSDVWIWVLMAGGAQFEKA